MIMKKYLLLLLVCTTAMSAFAQNETRRALSEREVRTNNQEEARDTRAKLYEIQQMNIENHRADAFALRNAPVHRLDSMVAVVQGTRHSKEAYEFNADGTLKARIQYSWHNNAWARGGRFEYEWDNNGNRIQQITSSWHTIGAHANTFLPLTKTVFAYDNAGNRILYRRYDSYPAWEYFIYREYEYDSNGNRISIIFFREEFCWWEFDNIMMRDKQLFEFDNAGNMTMRTEFNWDFTNGVWVGREWGGKVMYEFNAHGHPVKRLEFDWDTATGDWVPADWRPVITFRNEYEFDTEGRITSHIVYRDNGPGENPANKFLFEFDINGNMTLKTIFSWQMEWNQNWEIIGGYWEQFAKYIREYDNAGNRILDSRYFYDWWDEFWAGEERTRITFDSEGRIIFGAVYRWHNAGRVWQVAGTVEFEFDSNGNLISEIIDVAGEPTLKTVWEFDPNYYLFSDVKWGIEGVVMVNKMTVMREYVLVSGNWVEFAVTTAHYSALDDTVDIPNRPTASIAVFPNPVSDSFTVSGITENTLVTVTDLSGRTVLQQMVSPNESVSVGHLPQGMFLVRVNETVVKIIKQ